MTVRIAVVGAGLIGRRHAAAVTAARGCALASIVEPAAVGMEIAAFHGVPHYRSLAEMIAADRPDGVILATPNHLHVDGALECIAAGLPTIVEKPLAVDLAGAAAIVDASREARVPVLTGHHRRHNALVERAKAIVDAGELGRLVTVEAVTWFCKPDDYFEIEWRRRNGAGPISINLVHDIDLMRHLCGEILEVQAMTSVSIRGFEVEDTAVVLVRFENDALGTLSVSDAAAAPWSWELTAGENPAYPTTQEGCYRIAGTKGSLSLPDLALWSHQGDRGWMAPITATRFAFGTEDPLIRQVRQFAAVILGAEEPLVPAVEGLRNLKIVDAIRRSASTGSRVLLS